MKNQIIRYSFILLAASIPSASFATTITFGGTSVTGQGIVSSVAGVTTVDFNSGALPANYSGGSVVSGSVSNVYLSPTDDTSFYTTTGTGSTVINLASTPATYFGLYWGSIDAYNTITFSGTTGTESYTGTQIAALDGLTPDGNTSIYVNFAEAKGASWNKITLSSTQNAFETDNHAFITATPEPSTALLLGTGGLLLVAGFGFRRRHAANLP